MQKRSAFEFNPEMPGSSLKLFDRFRLLSILAFLVAVAVAAFVAR